MFVSMLLLMKFRLPVFADVRLGAMNEVNWLDRKSAEPFTVCSAGISRTVRLLTVMFAIQVSLGKVTAKLFPLARKFRVLLRLVRDESHLFKRWQLLISRSSRVVTSIPSKLLRKVSLMTMDLALVTPGVLKVKLSRAVSAVQLIEPTVFSDKNDNEARAVRFASWNLPVMVFRVLAESPFRKPACWAMKLPLTWPRPLKSTKPAASSATKISPVKVLHAAARAVASAGEWMVVVDAEQDEV